MGASQNNQSCLSPHDSPPKASRIAGPVDRAGFTDVLVTGMLTRWINVSESPMARAAKPFDARLSVVPMITMRKIAVSTISITRPANRLYCPGEWSPYPLAATPPAASESFVVPLWLIAISHNVAEAAIAAITCVTMYGTASFHAKRLAAARPIVIAGLKCPPEMWPTAYAIVSTVNPNAKATPTKPIPRPLSAPVGVRKLAARTALPVPPNTSTNVPANSAPKLEDQRIDHLRRTD